MKERMTGKRERGLLFPDWEDVSGKEDEPGQTLISFEGKITLDRTKVSLGKERYVTNITAASVENLGRLFSLFISVDAVVSLKWVKNRGNDPTSNPSRHEAKGHLHWYLFQELTTPVTKSEPLVSSSGKAREKGVRGRDRGVNLKWGIIMRQRDLHVMWREWCEKRMWRGKRERERKWRKKKFWGKEWRTLLLLSLSIYRWFPLNLCVSLGHSPPLKSWTSLPADESPTCLWEPSWLSVDSSWLEEEDEEREAGVEEEEVMLFSWWWRWLLFEAWAGHWWWRRCLLVFGTAIRLLVLKKPSIGRPDLFVDTGWTVWWEKMSGRNQRMDDRDSGANHQSLFPWLSRTGSNVMDKKK